MTKRSEAPSVSDETRAYSRDEHEAELLEQFFSWPPPPPRAADLRFDPFERAPLPRGTRRAIWASSLMLITSIGLIGGYFAYHNYVMPAPAALGDWSDTDTLPLPKPILADDIAQAEPEPRRVYQASLQHDMSAIKQAEPVADEHAPAAAPAESEAPALAPGEPADGEARAPGSEPAAAGEPVQLEEHEPAGARDETRAVTAPGAPVPGESRGVTAPAPGESHAAAAAQGEARAATAPGAPAPGESRAATAPGDAAAGAARSTAAPGAQAQGEARAVANGAQSSGPALQAQAEPRAAGVPPSAAASDARSQSAARALNTAAETAAPAARAGESPGPVASAAPASQKPVPAADAAVNFYEQLSIAQQQLAQGELRQSLPTFERALALRAHSVDALLGKATALFGLKEYEAAKSSAQLAVAIDPRSNEAFGLIGGSLEWLGHRAEAKAIYERCVEEAVDATVCRERLAHLTESK